MKNHAEMITALYESRRDGTLPVGVDDAEFDDGLAAQLNVLEKFESEGYELGGWKVGLTSGMARDRMGEGYRPFGFILKDRILASGSTTPIPVSRIINCQIEPELALIIGAPLRGGSVSSEEAKTAVSGVAPAFEINEVRRRIEESKSVLNVGSKANAQLFLADGLANWGIALGKAVTVRDHLVDTKVDFYKDGQLLETNTPGDTMDDPYLSLSRLCALLHQHGRGLEPGQAVITGSFCHVPVQGAASFRAVFENIGEVELTFP